MKVLITGFDPFGGESINPAYEAVKRLPSQISGAEIVTLEVPTVFGKSIEAVTTKIDQIHPDVVICVGQAGGRFEVTPERVAINVDDARIPDNEGNQPLGQPVLEGAPDAYFSTLPVKAMVQKIRKRGIPSALSNTAGTFVCNHLMFGVLDYLHQQNYGRGGFIHIPFLMEQVVDKPGKPGMALETLTSALEAAIEACVEHETDVDGVGGTLH
ncbi:MAG: pyroglutamyl-peptidase I [Spirochaetales bacterium]|nr:pyroglutamyl-peptidase I [Spirochaetales bacterium]